MAESVNNKNERGLFAEVKGSQSAQTSNAGGVDEKTTAILKQLDEARSIYGNSAVAGVANVTEPGIRYEVHKNPNDGQLYVHRVTLPPEGSVQGKAEILLPNDPRAIDVLRHIQH